MTVVEVKVAPDAKFPSGYINRHIFGVCEKFKCWVNPVGVQISWGDMKDIVWEEIRDDYCVGFMPTYSFSENITLGYCGDSFDVHLTCVTPSGIDARLFSLSNGPGVKGTAGNIGMFLDFSLLPSNVSFAGLRVSEESSACGTHSGYFSDVSWSDKWYHTPQNGAGRWNTVGSESNYYAVDEAYIGNCAEPWSLGILNWEIPNVWLPPTNRVVDVTPHKITFKVIWQTMSITPDGTVSVSKHGYTVSRSTNDVITINGVVWQ